MMLLDMLRGTSVIGVRAQVWLFLMLFAFLLSLALACVLCAFRAPRHFTLWIPPLAALPSLFLGSALDKLLLSLGRAGALSGLLGSGDQANLFGDAQAFYEEFYSPFCGLLGHYAPDLILLSLLVGAVSFLIVMAAKPLGHRRGRAHSLFLLIAAALLVLNVVGRETGLVMKAIGSEKPERASETEYTAYCRDAGGHVTMLIYNDNTPFVYARDVPFYAAPDDSAQPVETVAAGTETCRWDIEDIGEPTKLRGWLYCAKSGLYVRISDLLDAFCRGQSPGVVNLMGRRAVMYSTLSCYIKGTFISADIGRVWAPWGVRLTAAALVIGLLIKAALLPREIKTRRTGKRA